MKASIPAHELMALIRKAELAYDKKGTVAISQRIRISAMKRFVSDMRQQSPSSKVEISLEDHLLLTDLPQ